MRLVGLVAVLAGCSLTRPTLAPDADVQTLDGASSDGATDDATGTDAQSVAGFVRSLTVAGTVTGGPHPNFPLAVALSGMWLRDEAHGGDVVYADASDLYITADQGGAQVLSYEIETYDPTIGTLVAWVKIPSLASGGVVYLHYGDAAVTTSKQDAASVWSAGYELVLHLAAPVTDSTGKNTITNAASGVALGAVGVGRVFDGINDYVNAGSDTKIDNVFAGGGSVEIWFKATDFGENGFARLFDKGPPGGSTTSSWSMLLRGVDNNLGFDHGSAGVTGTWDTAQNSITTGVWHHVVAVFDKDSSANDASIYLDGAPATVVETAAPSGTMASDAAYDLWVGNRDGTDRTFKGILDEARLSSVTRSADWIATEYANQDNLGTFVTVSAPL